MPRKLRVMLATEGTYPYHLGGVSTWCDMLVHRVEQVDFTVFAVAMNPFVRSRFDLPPSIGRVVTVPLWGTQDPSEHKEHMPFSEIFLQKQRTTEEEVARDFLPEFLALLGQMRLDGERPEVVGNALAAMHRHFQVFDYRETFKAEVVWQAFRVFLHEAAEAGVWPEPTVFEAAQALGWVYHFFTVLNTPLPDVDVVHSSAAAFCGMAGIVAKIEYGTPYLLTEHGVYLREQYLSVGRSNMSRFSKRFLLATVRMIVKANLYYADRIAPVCAFNARWEKLLGAAPDRIGVVYNGVSPQVFAPAPKSHDWPPRLLSIARIDPNKDIETLLRAMAIVHAHFPDVRLAVWGSIAVEDYHKQMLDLRRELGLEETVLFEGHSENPADLYREADILIQSSVSEAFPYSVIEGMMSGLAVVATDVGGTSEALADTGITVPSRDPARLAVAIIILLQDAALRERLGVAARERALTFFTTQRATQEYSLLYEQLAGRALPRTAAAVAGDLAPLALGIPSRQIVHLQRAYALLRLGMQVAALDQFHRALELAPDSEAAPAILSQVAAIEEELGQGESALQHYMGAWLLAQVQVA